MKNIGKARNRLVRRVIGFLGLLCLSISVFGYWRVQVKDKEENAKATASKSNVTNEVSSDYYPLDVGRYWVYTRQDPMEGDPVEVRRQIVRHEHHVNRDVYFFEDGSIAYRDGNKVFEVSPEGGVDVVFASKVNVGEAFLYRSQGMHIEKKISAVDTLIMAGGRSYENCVKVVTSFRRAGASQDYNYDSYYAPAIGLVERKKWPVDDGDTGDVLRDFGARQL